MNSHRHIPPVGFTDRGARVRSRIVLVCILTTLGLLASAGDSLAHTKSTSYSRLAPTSEGADLRVRMPLLELTRFPPDHDWPGYLATHLVVRAGEERCVPTPPTRLAETAPGWAVFRWSVACPGDGPLSIESHIFADVLSNHLHFARVRDAEQGIREQVLVAASPRWSLAPEAEESASESLAGYFLLGVEHILSGWDHLAFVAALLLLAHSLREVATLVTSFTLAHSLTLALAVLGILRPEGAAVEILIGFSIALVAAENAWILTGRDRRIPSVFVVSLIAAGLLAGLGSGTLTPLAWAGLALFSFCHFGLLQNQRGSGAWLRAVIAFAFGLVHGFGFAGILMEIELPAQRLVPALLGFNLGVEAGQLGVVLLVWPALRALAGMKKGTLYLRLAESGSAVIAGLGVYWVVSRNWG